MGRKEDEHNPDREPEPSDQYKREYEGDCHIAERLNQCTGSHVASTSSAPIDEDGNQHKRRREHKGNFDELTALINESVHINFNKFDGNIIRLIGDEDNMRIEGLEGRIYEVLNQDEEEEFENEENVRKQCFLRWVQVFDGCDSVTAAVYKKIKTDALNQGIDLSRILVDIMFYMSYDRYHEMMETFLVMETAFEWVVKGERSLVIHKILEIMRAADVELRKKKRAEMLENSSTGKKVIVIKDKYLVDRIIFPLMKEIFRMELYWMHQGLLACEDMIRNGIEIVVKEIEKCDIKLVTISLDVHDLFYFLFGSSAEEWKDCAEYEALDAKIVQLWRSL